jgi:serine/threonine protein kinase
MIQSLSIGSTIKETYTILEKIGEGAFSEVFLVRHKFLGLQAMKVFKSNSVSPTSDQFKEAFILTKVAHPNIVHIFEANKISGTDGERSYVTMECAAGGTLQSFLSARPLLSLATVVRIQRQICAGLSAAHSQRPPIIHRDIKPQNILVTSTDEDCTVKVADFGLAKNIDPRLRMVSAAGTLLYMPPEGFHHYETPASDVYSAGIILYEMLTGTFPFPLVEYTNEHEFRLGLAKTRAVVPQPPSTLRPSVSSGLDQVSLQALQPDITKRFQTAMEFLLALDSLDNSSKTVRPNPKSLNRDGSAELKVKKAIQIGKQYNELQSAIQLLEEAFVEDPRLRDQYGEFLARWKAGVIL